MKDPSQTSPFAALTLKEQQAKWTAWQSQHLDEKPLAQPVEALPPVKLPRGETAARQAPAKPEATPPQEAPRKAPSPFPPPRHSQYDAVLKRMELAKKKGHALA